MISNMKKWTDRYRPAELILHQDQNIVVVNKPAGVPSQSDKTGDLSLFEGIRTYLNEDYHISNRLDRPVSGAVVLIKRKIESRKLPFRKSYLAITQKPPKDEDVITHYVRRDPRTKKARVVSEEQGKRAKLSYRIIQEMDKYVVLEISPKTGRFHQIRAQLAAIGCPIRGDIKYGARRGNKDRSIGLHAYKITLPDSTIIAPVINDDSIWQHVDVLSK